MSADRYAIPRRFVLLQLLMLWQGGFLFYALIVVPIGGDVLGSETTQGFITRRVTVWLNGFGGACLVAAIFDIRRTSTLRILRQVVWFLAVLMQIALVILHPRMDALLDADLHIVNDTQAFYRLHAIYLSVSGVLWFAMLCSTIIMLLAWRSVDASTQTIIQHREDAK